MLRGIAGRDAWWVVVEEVVREIGFQRVVVLMTFDLDTSEVLATYITSATAKLRWGNSWPSVQVYAVPDTW